jgi:hypothetical protein
MAAATKAARDLERKATPAKAAIPPTAAAVNDNLGLEDTCVGVLSPSGLDGQLNFSVRK